jgi:hypothetical protein
LGAKLTTGMRAHYLSKQENDMNMKFTAIALLTLLTACGGSGGDSDDDREPTGIINDDTSSLSITGSNHTATVNSINEKAISITGDNNTVYIQTPIESLDILGSENTIEISNGVTIGECSVTGSDNHASKPSQMSINCDITGSNNKGFN